MKNWNEAGTVHYDSATAQSYTEVTLRFEHVSQTWTFKLAIPQRIRQALKGEDFDQAVILAKRVIEQTILRLAISGQYDFDTVSERTHLVTRMAVLEQLYNAFTLAQAAAGNQVWETPRSMQDVGSDPMEELKELVQ